jgi:adenosylcobinamide kinase/adenosylcobinamide-phosphate guanylyltransferase
LVLGGARSGKSRWAEALVEGAACCGTYCATAEAGDDEMTARIAAHRARREPFWRTVEEPLALTQVIAAEAAPGRPLLIDCLTLWLSNLLLAEKQADDEGERLCVALRLASGPVVLVANEVGMGLVPETPLGRRFRDAAGRLNQQVAALADRVVFVAAGLPLVLKERSSAGAGPHPRIGSGAGSPADAGPSLPRFSRKDWGRGGGPGRGPEPAERC